MTIFAIIRQEAAANNDELSNLIAEKFPGDFYKLGNGQWLISSGGTTQTISKELGIVKGTRFRSTLVLATTSYYGVHSTELWEWMRSKLEGPGND